MALLYGLAGRLTAKNGGFRPGQSVGIAAGYLMVTGGGDLPRASAARFRELAGGAAAKIVYVPTNDGLDYSDENVRAMAVASLERSTGWKGQVTLVHTTDPAVASTAAFVAPIDAATGVWFGGGRQWRMVDAYAGTRAESSFRRVLQRGGIVGGSSAGASILGDFMVRGDSGDNRVMMGDHRQGFGYVHNVAFDQHTLRRNRQADMVEVVTAHPDLLGFSLDEQTSLLLRGDELEVIGSVARGKTHKPP
jgi:cyanophycinase